MSEPQNPQPSSTFPPVLSPDGAPVPTRWVEDLFARLAAIVGTSMATVYAGVDEELVKAEWAQALAGFSADEVRRGIAATRTRRFAPNLAEFLHLCRPSLDPEIAWEEAGRGLASHARGKRFAWSHPAVYWAARPFDFELRSSTFEACRKRWSLALGLEFAKGAWASPPDPTPRIAAPVSPPADPKRVAAELSRLRETQPDSGQHAGPKGWACRLRDREAAGDQLRPAQRRFWREALGIDAVEVR